MAAVASSPQIIRDGRLQYGGIDVQLTKGTSFWARTDRGNETRIQITLPSAEKFHTTFSLVLPTQEAYHKAMRDLLTANINANQMFNVDHIQMIDAAEDSPAKIHLRFTDRSGACNFSIHGSEICNDHGFDVEPIEGKVILTARSTTPLNELAAKINELFQAITSRLGNGNIYEALARMDDRRFPVKERESGGQCISAIECSDRQRVYELSQGKPQEVIYLANPRKTTVSPEEINAWLESPESFQGQQVQKYLHFVTRQWADYPFDLVRLKEFIPGYLLEDARFDEAYRGFLTRTIGALAKERPVNATKLAEFLLEAGKIGMDVADLLYPKPS